jgi:hypothetical protein
LQQRIRNCEQDSRVLTNQVSVDVCVGADLFFRETFQGNGRSCTSCHRVENNFTIDPAFIKTLPSKDPLFVAELNSTLKNLERPQQMRARSLILENADGVVPDPNIRFVLRSVPHNLSMGTSVTRAAGDTVTPPDDRTGWSGDGAPNQGKLRDFQTGAIIQHYTKRLNRVAGVDFRLATDAELDRIDLFMRRLGRENELTLAEVVMADSGAEAGRLTFLSAAARCNGCHADAGANAGFGGGGNRNFNTGVESARNVALASFPRDGGFLGAPANADGSFGDGTFNTPPLVEAADTGPFFHTDTTVSGASAHNATSANTIEQAIAFYDTPAFNNSPAASAGQIDLDATQINNLARFLRAVNAAFNAQMAISRLEAVVAIVTRFGNDRQTTQRTLLRLAKEEVDDAIKVLDGQSGLNRSARDTLQSCRSFINSAINSSSSSSRKRNTQQALSRAVSVTPELGSGLDFVIGEGTVMF